MAFHPNQHFIVWAQKEKTKVLTIPSVISSRRKYHSAGFSADCPSMIWKWKIKCIWTHFWLTEVNQVSTWIYPRNSFLSLDNLQSVQTRKSLKDGSWQERQWISIQKSEKNSSFRARKQSSFDHPSSFISANNGSVQFFRLRDTEAQLYTADLRDWISTAEWIQSCTWKDGSDVACQWHTCLVFRPFWKGRGGCQVTHTKKEGVCSAFEKETATYKDIKSLVCTKTSSSSLLSCISSRDLQMGERGVIFQFWCFVW